MTGQRSGPAPPGLAVVLLTQLHEMNVIIQPTLLFVAPTFKGLMAFCWLLRPGLLQRSTKCCGPPIREGAVQRTN